MEQATPKKYKKKSYKKFIAFSIYYTPLWLKRS